MGNMRTTDLQDSKVPDNIVLSSLWTSTLFVFAYVDIFGFWRADVINGALNGIVPGAGLRIDQTFLALSTASILIPSLMIVASLLLPARVNRLTNIIISLLYLSPPWWWPFWVRAGRTTSSVAWLRLPFFSPSSTAPGPGKNAPRRNSPEPKPPKMPGPDPCPFRAPGNS